MGALDEDIYMVIKVGASNGQNDQLVGAITIKLVNMITLEKDYGFFLVLMTFAYKGNF
jgi:hypothetical protein